MSILDLDATSLAKKIKSGEITSLEATESYIKHIKKINPSLNCLVQERFDEAREEARRCDRLVREGKSGGRLFGVPVSVKESFNVEGMKTAVGLKYRKDLIEERDAEAVARLKSEGVVILGKTNTPTVCFSAETVNKLYGQTNNPWDVTRTTGGSSGGEASLIAAGGAAVGIGSDFAGSVRLPSHFNGVVGFKSGNCQVSQKGHIPCMNGPFQERMVGIGAIAKSVVDARLINEIIAVDIPEEVDIAEFKINIPLKHPSCPPDDKTDSVLAQIRNSLSRDFETESTEPPLFEDSERFLPQIMFIDGGSNLAMVAFGNRPVRPAWEYLKEVVFGASDIHRYLLWNLIGAKMLKPGRSATLKIKEQLDRGDGILNEYLKHRVLILPVYHCPALPHGRLFKEISSPSKSSKYSSYIAYANVWGLPSLVVPAGEDDGGLPIGVQLVSRVGNEDALFKIGRIVEERFRGYIRCSKYD